MTWLEQLGVDQLSINKVSCCFVTLIFAWCIFYVIVIRPGIQVMECCVTVCGGAIHSECCPWPNDSWRLEGASTQVSVEIKYSNVCVIRLVKTCCVLTSWQLSLQVCFGYVYICVQLVVLYCMMITNCLCCLLQRRCVLSNMGSYREASGTAHVQTIVLCAASVLALPVVP